jgi:hypothetical protein
MKKLFLTALTSYIILASAILHFSLKYGRRNNSVSAKPAVYGCCSENMESAIVSGESVAYFEGEKVEIPRLAMEFDQFAVLGVSSQQRWIEVDLSEQKLTAWDGDSVFLQTPVSTGLPWWPTPTGEFRIWIKLRATKMEGGTGKYYYYLPNVPYVMYFENAQVPGWRGYGLHGTYWHNDFGTQRSHGCVNLPTEMAAQLYYWVSPELGNSKWAVRSDPNNPGTRVVIHE